MNEPKTEPDLERILAAPHWLRRIHASTAERWRNSHWAIRLVAIACFFVMTAAVAGVIGAIVGKPIDDALENPKSRPFIAVILSQGEKDFTIPLELQNGIQEDNKLLTGPDGENVAIRYFLPARNERETRDAVRENCLKVESCIAVVGGSDSTTTEAMLSEIINFDYPEGSVPPALISPIATATKITEFAARSNYGVLLRLVPNNRDQARRITSFISKGRPSQRVLIIRDNKNPIYADDLTSSLESEIKDNGGDPRTLQYVDTSTLQNAKIRGLSDVDMIVFVGTAENGISVIADLKRYNITTPTIFSDGNTTRETIVSSVGSPGEIYFLTPVSELTNFSEPGYTAIGRDTFKILSIILGLSDKADRNSVAKIVASNKHNISLTQGAAGDYKFGLDGENSAMSFQILTARDGRLHRQTRF